MNFQIARSASRLFFLYMLITIWFVAIYCVYNNTALASLSLWLTMVNSLIHQKSKQQQCITHITGWLWRHFVPKSGVLYLTLPLSSSFSLHFSFLPFLFLSLPFPLPSLYSPFRFLPLSSFFFPLPIPSNPARRSAERWKWRLCWLKSYKRRRRQSYCDKSSVSHLAFQVDFKSPVSHIFHQSVTFLYVTDSGDYRGGPPPPPVTPLFHSAPPSNLLLRCCLSGLSVDPYKDTLLKRQHHVEIFTTVERRLTHNLHHVAALSETVTVTIYSSTGNPIYTLCLSIQFTIRRA